MIATSRLTAAEAAEARKTLAEATARRKAAKAGDRPAEAPGPANVYDLVALNRLVDELREAREAQGLSLADVSERTGIDRAALNKIETRKNQNPTYGTLARYAAAVGRSLTLGLGPASARKRIATAGRS
ncbi:MAG: helix-turn-helix transcriptional regulator [Planctomycetaceae bacterium]